jgi:hypothetical protein
VKTLPVLASLVLLAAGARAGDPSRTPKGPTTPEALKAEIEALKPDRHVWRALAWRTCPLEALSAARAQKKPVLVWVFLGLPTDERC